ncbi:DNA repair protein RecN [bacterium]|nr:DNA repair protein RecN [bacterium]
MLKSIKIKNYILIDSLSLEFKEGFTAFTGETGAGKSIIISAVDVALGSKVTKEVIKTGQEKAYIELCVTLNDNFDRQKLSENGIDDLGEELIISREILPTSSRSRINGVLVTQDFIKEIREYLIDIHTQHQNFNYLKPKSHINLLDNYADDTFKEILNKYKKNYQEYLDISNTLDKVQNAATLTEQQIEFLKFQIDEITSVGVEDKNEDENLKEELELLTNAEKLKEYSYSSYWALYGDEKNITDSLSEIKMNISKLSQLDSSVSPMEEELTNIQEQLKDIATRLRDYSDSKEADEERINAVQERLYELEKLKRKYGGSLEKVLENLSQMKTELEGIDNSQENRERLEKLKQEKLGELKTLSAKMTEMRKETALRLQKPVEEELEKLDLPKVRFVIDLESCTLNELGEDKVEFLVSTNVSEEPKPMIKVASGGEISRIMLALKTVFAHTDNTSTVIFDEIDTGISGKAAQAVADSISELSKYHQVMMITHQPIVAAKATEHFYVVKDQNATTEVKVYNLRGENRVKAIALLAAGEINDQSMSFAKGLLEKNTINV